MRSWLLSSHWISFLLALRTSITCLGLLPLRTSITCLGLLLAFPCEYYFLLALRTSITFLGLLLAFPCEYSFPTRCLSYLIFGGGSFPYSCSHFFFFVYKLPCQWHAANCLRISQPMAARAEIYDSLSLRTLWYQLFFIPQLEGRFSNGTKTACPTALRPFFIYRYFPIRFSVTGSYFWFRCGLHASLGDTRIEFHASFRFHLCTDHLQSLHSFNSLSTINVPLVP